MHDGFGDIELLRDLGNTERWRVRTGERLQDLRGALYGGDRLSLGIVGNLYSSVASQS
jgi:hypothetical protein